jgi:AraC-like DNA-binding protein
MNVIPSQMHDLASGNGPAGGIDPLTRLLHGLRLDGIDYGRRHLWGEWAFSFGLSGSAYFHVVNGAACWLRVDDGEWSELRPGDAVLLPHGDPHILASAPDVGERPHPVWRCRPLSEDPYEPASLEQKGGSLLFYGSMRFNIDREHPLFRAMPPVLHARAMAEGELGMSSLLEALANEMTSRRVGAAGLAARLADVLAVQIIRSWVEDHVADTGWLAAARHSRIGAALAAIHAEPDEAWSVDRLAGQAGLSRSVFAATFATIVGDTPARYLTEVRMRQARQWLAEDGARIADVAQRLRYESEASFSRAFKRVMGVPPSTYRHGWDIERTEMKDRLRTGVSGP